MKRRRSVIIAVIGISFLAAALCCAYFISTALCGSHVRRASVNFDDGYTLEIWDKYPNWDQWDPDIADPNVYYKISQHGTIIVPDQSLQMLDFHYKYDLRIAYAANKTLVCAYDEQLWGEGVFIIFDKVTKMAWHETSDKDWLTRYNKLIQENPTMPRFSTIQ